MMDMASTFTFEAAMSEICRGVLEAVDRPEDSAAARLRRQQTTIYSLLSFRPRDPVEAMLAGQCVIFDHLLRRGMRDLSRGPSESARQRAKPGILAAGKTFLAHLTRLDEMRK